MPQKEDNSVLRPATREDALFLSERLREEDIQEIYASSGLAPLEALLQGLETCTPHVWVLEDPKTSQPYLMGGVRALGDGLGMVWLLTSPEIERHTFTFQREAKLMLMRIFNDGQYRAVGNVVSAGNLKAIAWLERLGFTFVDRDVPIGPDKTPFHSFAIGRGQAYV